VIRQKRKKYQQLTRDHFFVAIFVFVSAIIRAAIFLAVLVGHRIRIALA